MCASATCAVLLHNRHRIAASYSGRRGVSRSVPVENPKRRLLWHAKHLCSYMLFARDLCWSASSSRLCPHLAYAQQTNSEKVKASNQPLTQPGCQASPPARPDQSALQSQPPPASPVNTHWLPLSILKARCWTQHLQGRLLPASNAKAGCSHSVCSKPAASQQARVCRQPARPLRRQPGSLRL
eukprot:365349-Chlamydomonas_euryale.AAC.11